MVTTVFPTNIDRAVINDCDDDGKLKLKIQLFKPKRSKLKTLLDFIIDLPT